MRGRPSTYTPDIGARLAQHRSLGGTLASFAASIGIDERTLRTWRRLYLAAIAPEPTQAPTVTHRPLTAAVFSLAAWGISRPRVDVEGIELTWITDEDVDDMLARAA